MKAIFTLATILLWAHGYSSAVAAEDVAPATGGVIKFAQKLENGEPGGQTCSYDIAPRGYTMVYNFRKSKSPCNNDVHSWFRIDNAPSAVLIELRSDAPETGDKCRSDSDTRWIFRLRTTKQRTTTGWVSIPGLTSSPDKSIVDPGGLRLDSKKYDNDSGNVEGKLSCVKIDY